MKRDNMDILPVRVTGPITLSADNTSASVDLVSCNAALIQIGVGIGGITFDGTNKIEFKVTHSDDDVTFDPVTAADVIPGPNADTTVGAGGIVRSLIAAHAAPTVALVSYIGNRRYLRVQADFSGTHGTGTPISVNVIQSRLNLSGTTI